MGSQRTGQRSLTAGILIGFGVIINILTQPPILGALLFSFGLLTIIYLKLPLYTGRTGFINDTNPLLKILLFNMIGIMLLTLLYMRLNNDFLEMITAAAQNKFSKTYLQMFVGGILCGMLIHFAVKCKQPIITMGAVIIFILIGAEHCIADFPYCIVLLTYKKTVILKFLLVIIGNAVGAKSIEWLIEGKNE